MKANAPLLVKVGSSRIALASWSLRPAGPQQLLMRLRQLNLSAVQLALSPVIRQPQLWGSAIEELRDGGVWIVSGMMAMVGEDSSTLESITRTGGLRPDQTWFANHTHAEQIARLACTAGIPLVTLNPGFIPQDRANPERAKLTDRLRTVAEVFAHYKVDVALETGQESADTLAQVLDDLAYPNVGVNFDPANMIRFRTGHPVQSLRRLAPYIRQVHIRDAVIISPTAESCGQEVPAGEGAIDWDAFFQAALDLHPPVQFVIERESRPATDQDIAAAQKLIADHLMPQIRR
ncbi:MAG: sugar phosphate isomerase/epimerase [Phycisphaerales bacterium]|nr:sugar phosphate isomerase/epimerase [Phycisphaerales bacterium]MCI0674451.1 sugar phosphate isomerase/epimerase [Phycisphaerales bacterium]